MKVPLWVRVLLWVQVLLVFVMNLWLTPYAIVLAWGIPWVLERWSRHMEVVEELVYTASAVEKADHGERAFVNQPDRANLAGAEGSAVQDA